MRKGIVAVRVTAVEQCMWTAGAMMLRTTQSDFVRQAVTEKLERLASSRPRRSEGA